MIDEPAKKDERKGGSAEAREKLKELFEKLPEDERRPVRDELLARIQDAAQMTEAEKELFTELIHVEELWLTEMTRLEREAFVREIKADCGAVQQMTKTEKKVYLRERACRKELARLPESQRESFLEAIKTERDKYAKMTDAEKETYWKTEEAFDELISKVVPVVIRGIQEHYVKPHDASQPELEEARRKINESLRRTGASEVVAETAFCLLSWIVEVLKEEIEPLKSYVKIDRYLRILLGDSYLSELPVTLQGHMKARGVEKRIQDMHLDEIIGSLVLPEKDSWIDTVLPTLDMLFEERYGWPEGTAETKTISELCLALEHAVEHDDPEKPSVWKIT